MWAYSGADTTAQWIEIYNNGAVLKADDSVILRFHSNARVDNVGKKVHVEAQDNADPVVVDDGEIYVVVDAVSTVDAFGRSWAPKGQNGVSANTEEDGTFRAAVNLVSMYRVSDLTGVGTKTEFKPKDDKTIFVSSFGDGTDAGRWAATGTRANISGAFVGTPGRAPIASVATTKNPGSISATGIIINEVRNDSSDANLDWIEIFYHGVPGTDNAINIDGYELNMVTPNRDAVTDVITTAKKEVTVVNFPKYKLQAGEYFVVYNRDPGDTVLAGGVSAVDVEAGTQVNKGASHAYFVADQTDADHNLVPLNLPSDEMFLLVLRSANDQDNEPDAIKDIAGNGFFSLVETAPGYDPDHRYDTRLFPVERMGCSG